MKPFIARIGTLAATATLAGGLALAASGTALAANPHAPGTSGQPSQTCLSGTAPGEPGNAASSPGSPFNEPTDTSPGGVAGGVYAGSQPQNSNNPNSVSQYDVACFQVSQH
jgi:hypothetical protein